MKQEFAYKNDNNDNTSEQNKHLQHTGLIYPPNVITSLKIANFVVCFHYYKI